MLLCRDPYAAIAPAAEVSELLYFVMTVLDVIFHGQASRIEHTDITAKSEEDTRGFKCQQS